MQILLTGGSGYLGSAILRRLVADGHSVLAVARSEASASAVAADGATPARGDARDIAWLSGQMASVDAVVHAASPNDATSGTFDDGVLRAVEEALAGAERAFIMTGGTWVYGNGSGLNEASPIDAPPIVGWRPAVLERTRRLTELGIRSVIIEPGMLYGHGGGLPVMLQLGPVTPGEAPALIHPGDGSARVSNVAVDDAADFYALALSAAQPGARFVLAQDDPPTMRSVAEAASRGRGLDGRVAAETDEQTRARLGMIADPLLLDQTFDSSAARVLGWSPHCAGLLEELATGSYATSVPSPR